MLLAMQLDLPVEDQADGSQQAGDLVYEMEVDVIESLAAVMVPVMSSKKSQEQEGQGDTMMRNPEVHIIRGQSSCEMGKTAISLLHFAGGGRTGRSRERMSSHCRSVIRVYLLDRPTPTSPVVQTSSRLISTHGRVHYRLCFLCNGTPFRVQFPRSQQV
jgi:hypothetical protein